MSKLEQILGGARDTLTVSKVYGEPYEKNGITFIPAAAVMGGAGGGEGETGDSTQEGAGGGFGVIVRPVGAYRIEGDKVTWVPAVDTTKIAVAGQLVVIVALLVIRSIFKRRRKG